MPEAFSVSVDQTQLNRLRTLTHGLGRDANLALSRAINRTLGTRAGGMRLDIYEEIKRTHNLTKSFIYKQKGKAAQKTFHIRKATPQHPTGKISTKGANVPIIYYSNQRGTRKKYAKKIYVKVKKLAGRHKLQHAFIPLLPSGHRGIFTRKHPDAKGERGRKIKELYSSRVPNTLINRDTDAMQRVMIKAQKRIDKNLKHEVDFILLTRK